MAFQYVATPIMALFIGAWLPNIAGVLITAVVDGRDGLRRLLSRVVRWQVGYKWMFNHTYGSLITPFLAHWAFNFTGSATGVYSVPALFWLITGLWWIVAAAIIASEQVRFTPHTLHPHLR